ncbi:MAG TPA: hypothetical protein VFX37_10515 [Pseudolabrys sp.]|nr:hypothetical protein [Pseudolabrys sp.]
MTTGADIVNQALKKAGILGVGRVATAEENNDALADLNNMLAEWNTQRWLVWNELDLAFVSTGQATPYTVGPGGNFNVSRRPDRIEASYLRQLVSAGLNVDTPIEIIPSREEYSRLSLKSLTSFPLYGFLDSAWPLANYFIYPWPQANIYETHIILKNVIPVITLVTDMSALPDHYISAMKFNLARRLRQGYGKGTTPDPELNALARATLDIVKQSNIQIPELVMPRPLIIQSSGYNILSDQFGNG